MDIKDIDFAIEILSPIEILSHPQSVDASDIKEAFKVAVESLKVQKESLEQEDVLDKIRAEIVELRSKQNVGVLECLDIIDKYRESEG